MQASTSPLYALIASNDVAAAIMDGPAGQVAHPGDDRRGRRLPSRRRARAPGIPCKEGLVLRALECGHRPRPEERQARPVSRSACGETRDGPELLGAAPRRRLARLRGRAGRLVHARPDQVWHRLPGNEDGRAARQERHSGRHRDGLSRAPRHRAVAHDGSHGAVPVLDGRDERQVGHAAQHLARFQGRLRPQRAACGGRAWRGRERAGSLRGHGTQGPRRRDVGAAAQEQARPLASPGLCHSAQAGDDAATRIPATDGRRRRESAACQDGGPCRRGGRHPVSARHSDRHAGREPGPERRSLAHVPAHAAGVRPFVSRDSPRKSKERKSTTAAIRSIASSRRGSIGNVRL